MEYRLYVRVVGIDRAIQIAPRSYLAWLILSLNGLRNLVL